jgi:hypothetical protein
MKDITRLEAHLANGETEYVMCAANYYNNGQDHLYQPYNIDKGFIVAGWRHPCCGQSYMAANPTALVWDDCIQGFLTTKNRFLNRSEALELVLETKQLTKPLLGGVLTSEDLW